MSLRRRLANPWGRPRGLAVTTWLYIVWAVVPVLLAVLFSFNDGRSRSSWQGFSTRWYTGETGSVFHDDTLQLALRNTVVLAVLTMLVATPLGVALAVGLTRWRSRAATASAVPCATTASSSNRLVGKSSVTRIRPVGMPVACISTPIPPTEISIVRP